MASNRERILESSIELFNQHGTIAMTTNHISKKNGISPGNLYFHFRGKDAIVRELFSRMCKDIYSSWDPSLHLAPRIFLERSFEVFWNFRFFHREMYHLRRRDPILSKAWTLHLRRCFRLLKKNYSQWEEQGIMKSVEDNWELKLLCDTVILSSSAYLGFFESPEKPGSKQVLRAGIDHVSRLLSPYYSEQYRKESMN